MFRSHCTSGSFIGRTLSLPCSAILIAQWIISMPHSVPSTASEITFVKLFGVRRKQKGNDLISLLMEIEEDGDVLTEEELYAQCIMLLFGGHETTRNLIGNGLY